NTLHWWDDDDFRPLFRQCGQYIHAHGLRVSMHPGQYTVLNSTNADVVERAIAEIVATSRVLDSLGVDASHKIVIHGGAGSPDHATALARFADNWPVIPVAARQRLVLENDERIFPVAELLPLCHRLQIPLVFDWLHHQANPGVWQQRTAAEILPEVFQTWHTPDGLPKVHYSSQAPGKRLGAHAYDLDPDDFRDFARAIGTQPVDVMAECKGKDLAVRALRNALGLDDTAR
ncbi:MAG TPA: UV DNA damage repair endonuclease UvsE, partial [Armatimonadota bacterium]